MKKLISVLGILFFCLFTFASVSLAQHSHGGMTIGTPDEDGYPGGSRGRGQGDFSNHGQWGASENAQRHENEGGG